MVKKPAEDEGMEVTGAEQQPATKRSLEDDANDSSVDEAVHQNKKIKTAIEESTEKELLGCEELLNNKSSSVQDKIRSLSKLFELILNNNVNTVILKDDFTLWVKNSIINVLKDVKKVPQNLFEFLTVALKVAPTAFEPVSESVINVCVFYPKERNVSQFAHGEFLKFLVNMFERLRRFPKLIAKLLCCARDNLLLENKSESTAAEAVGTDKKFFFEQILPANFMESIGPVVNLLPSGQVIDLWKTLHHNLEVECVKKLSTANDDSKTYNFLSVVSHIFAEFLSNVKVVDSAVPASTVQKVSEMMGKLRDECLKPLGLAILEKHNNVELTKSFLKLSYTWAELHSIMLCYNTKYDAKIPTVTNDPSNATNLNYLHSYLEPEAWMELGKRVLLSRDPVGISLLVSLVAQKMKYMTAMDLCQNNKLEEPLDSVNQEEVCVDDDIKSHQRLRQDRLKAAAEFIWSYQDAVNVPDVDETLTLVAQYVDSQKMIELAGNFVKQFQSLSQEETNVSCGPDKVFKADSNNLIVASGNQRFHYALVLEALGEVMRRIGKMKLLSKSIKTILNNSLSTENRADLLAHPLKTDKDGEKKQKEIILSLLNAVNSLIETQSASESESSQSSTKKVSEEFSSKLIDGMLKFLCNLELENYPKDVKTVVFLCSVVILIALVEQKTDDDILNSVAKIVADCGSRSQGNEILFSVKWICLYKWFSSNIDRFSINMQKDLCEVILANIYISPKLISEYEEKEFNVLCESFELTAPLGHVALITLEFLVKELQESKTKMTPRLQNHTRKLTQFVVMKLKETSISDTSTKKIKKRMSSNVASIESNIYRACWLARLGIKTLTENELSEFNAMLPSKVRSGLKFVKSCASIDGMTQDMKVSMTYALKFLHSICKSKEDLKTDLPDNFLTKLWKACIDQRMWRWVALKGTHFSKPVIPKSMIKDLYEAAGVEEFEEICSCIVSLTNTISSNEEAVDEISVRIATHLMDELIEAELPVGKKQFRRKAIEECLHAMIGPTLSWKEDRESLEKIVLPYVQFQTKLLRRPNPMVGVTSNAVCLTSVTSVPMNKIEDANLYRKVFCTIAELMNAFAVHRLDVLSFRSHVYLQCFQFIAESLAKRADQSNKLADGEIYDLRHCAHSIERICQSLKLGGKEFSRVSPYFVAVLMRQFEMFTIYPAVKTPLLSGCNKLLDLCDEHGIAQLNSMLTIGSREVFKTVYDLYKKYYQYKGKV